MLRRPPLRSLPAALAAVGVALVLAATAGPATAATDDPPPLGPGDVLPTQPPEQGPPPSGQLPALNGSFVGEFTTHFYAGIERPLHWYVRKPAGRPYATGTVTVTEPGAPDLVLELDSHGSVRFDGAAFPVGHHPVTVAYSGDARYAPESFTYGFTVSEPGPGMSPSLPRPVFTLDGPEQLVAGESPTFTVRSVGGGPAPTGTVTVWSFDSDAPYAADGVLVDGVATVTLPPAAPDTYVMYAGYLGDENYSSTNHAHAPIGLVVTPAPSPPSEPSPSAPPLTQTPTLPPTPTLAVPGRSAVALVGEPRSDLTVPATVTSRQSVTLEARGFLPGESVDFVLHSDPVYLGTVVADAAGVARLTVTIPAGVPAGGHHVLAAGLTSGTWSRVPVVVTASGGRVLAATGTSAAGATGIGVALIAFGAGLVAVRARTRRAAA